MRGISFPFRIGIRGGVVMSEDTYLDLAHLKDSLHQVICTSVGERCLHPEFGSEIATSIFEPDSQSSKTMLEFQTREAIKKDLDHIVELQGITSYFKDSKAYVTLSFSSKEFENVDTEKHTIEVGEIND